MSKRYVVAGVAASAFAFVPFAGMAKANDANFRQLQYHAYSQPVVFCAAAMVCEVTLQPGERVKDSVNSQAAVWDGQMLYEGDGADQVPHLVVKPPMALLAANVIITTNRRTYRILFRSVLGGYPSYVTFHYDDEARLAARLRARTVAARSIVVATPAPTIADEANAACSSMSSSDYYATDANPKSMRPARTCHTDRHTYVQLPATESVPTDVPVVMEVTPEGERTINSSYDADSRTYRIDGVGESYVLQSGKQRMRIQLQHAKAEASR